MDYGLIFHKTSTCYKNPDIEYLDETSEYKLRIKAKQTGISIESLRESNEQIQRDIAYLTKEEQGNVYAAGFLRDMILEKKGIAAEKWNNKMRKKAISSSIYKNIQDFGEYRGVVGHKLVFSVSEDFQQKVEDAGLNLDRVLSKEVKKVMAEFQRKFHPGEKIGYAWGIHHDTDNRHIHIYLCNRTDKGTHVAMSNPLKNRHSKYEQKDQIGFVKQRLHIAQQRIEKQVLTVSLGNNQNPEEVFVQPLKQRPTSASQVMMYDELEKQYERISRKEKELEQQQEQIRRFYAEYYLRQDLLRDGFKDVQNLNKLIKEEYSFIRKTKSVIPSKVFLNKGIISRSGPAKTFSNSLNQLQYTIEKRKRKAVMDRLQVSKLYKRNLLGRLQKLESERDAFSNNIRKLKDDLCKEKSELTRSKSRYQKLLESYHYDLFSTYTSDKDLKSEYKKLTEELSNKRKSGQDVSHILRRIHELNDQFEEKLKIQNQTKLKY